MEQARELREGVNQPFRTKIEHFYGYFFSRSDEQSLTCTVSTERIKVASMQTSHENRLGFGDTLPSRPGECGISGSRDSAVS